MYKIDDEIAKQDFIEAFNSGAIKQQDGSFLYQDQPTQFDFVIDKENYGNDRLIYGKDSSKGIVNISVKDNIVYTFYLNGDVIQKPFKPYVCSPISASGAIRLKGTNHYQYLKEYNSLEDIEAIKKVIWTKKLFYQNNPVEAEMLRSGQTYYKGLKPKDISILSFDIETSGLNPNANNARVFLITNTFRQGDIQYRKTFNVDNYEHDGAMIQDWCNWCNEVNPSLILGHNIYLFDLPYLATIAKKYNSNLFLGRDGSSLEFEDRAREKRKDGSQSYTYHRPLIFGRDLLDTFFLAITADSGRQFTSYGLKSLIRELGLEKEDRTYIDASKISQYWKDFEMKAKVITYAEEDSDDSLKLYDKFATAFFYFTQHVPKPFQLMTESATGGQINTFLLRGYLQDGYSFPKATETGEEKVEGGISFAVPGIYKNVLKVDLKSCYPSQILRFKLYDKNKDPFAFFYKMVHYFTYKRFEYKKLGQETGDSYYKDLDAVNKIVINSSFGMMNTGGCHFNNPKIAAKITSESREVIDMALRWASGKDSQYWFKQFHDKTKVKEDDRHHPTVNNLIPVSKSYDFIIGPSDTDSISFCKKDQSKFTDEETNELIKELNDISPEMMVWENDGRFSTVVTLKAKNYILQSEDGKIKFKGSSIVDQKKEPALREMLGKMCEDLIYTNGTNLQELYLQYIKEAKNPTDIMRWSQKKTATKSVLKCETDESARTNEKVVWEAIKDKNIQEGDKFYTYPVILSREIETAVLKNGKERVKETLVTGLRVSEDWNNDHDSSKLVSRVIDTVEILKFVVEENLFIDYSLKKNNSLLENL